jgi:hypothetical protein
MTNVEDFFDHSAALPKDLNKNLKNIRDLEESYKGIEL